MEDNASDKRLATVESVQCAEQPGVIAWLIQILLRPASLFPRITSGLLVIQEFLRSIYTSRLIGTNPVDFLEARF